MGQGMGQGMGQAGQPGSAEPEERAQGRSGVQAGMGRRQEQGEATTPRSSGAETPGRHSGSAFSWGTRWAALPGHTHTHLCPPSLALPALPRPRDSPALLLDIRQEEEAAEDVQPCGLTARSGSQPYFHQP